MCSKQIPKTIHYCWFGGTPEPALVEQCKHSWVSHWPGCEIKRWDETNFDINLFPFCREAYEAGSWAFVSDFARLAIIYEQGGVYLDTDVEMIRSIDLLIREGRGFIGFQNQEQVTTGLGFAAPAGNACVKAMLDCYENIKYEPGHTYPCPVYNTVALFEMGLKTGKEASRKVQHLDGLDVYPPDYFNPMDSEKKELVVTDHTYLINHYGSSWISADSKKRQRLKRLIPAHLLTMRLNYISKRDVDRVIKQRGIKR